MRTIVSFEIDKPNDYFIKAFQKHIGHLLSNTFTISSITSKDPRKRSFKITSAYVEDFYKAGMIGFHLELIEARSL